MAVEGAGRPGVGDLLREWREQALLTQEEVAARAGIVGLCGGLPLALAVVAARVVTQPETPLATVVDEPHTPAPTLGEPVAGATVAESDGLDEDSP